MASVGLNSRRRRFQVTVSVTYAEELTSSSLGRETGFSSGHSNRCTRDVRNRVQNLVLFYWSLKYRKCQKSDGGGELFFTSQSALVPG